ncbi:MAG: hypothetical protein V7642_5181 [Burkholderiales bacterium]
MPTVAAFKTERVALDLWRAVEAQHRVSTMVLVDTLDEQALLERLLEESKPPLAEGQDTLHWLLFTPFRYPPLPSGSRFRGPTDPGVFYGAELQRTACAELGYWRWRLLADSPDLDSIGPMQQTLFKTPISALSLDLRCAPLSRQRELWTHPSNYAPCQELARKARDAGVQMIRYESVRDRESGVCAAVLSHTAFAARAPTDNQTWTLAVFRHRVIWRLDSIFEDGSFEFDTEFWKTAGNKPASWSEHASG